MATTANPWSKPGGWALAAEEEEVEIQQKLAAAAAAKPIIPSSAFPDLAAAAAAPKSKKKGNKGQKLSLSEFNTYDAAPKQSAFQPSRGLTHEELAVLPTGPRERTAEEQAGARGFRSYNTREEQPRRQRESSFAPPSSRADEIDDWGAAKKFSPAANGSDRRERREGGSFFSDSQSSRADEVDNWASRKVAPPARLPERRSSAFESMGGEGRADADNWVKKKESDFPARSFGSSGGSFDSLRDRRGSGSAGSGDSPTGAVERPRLNLQPRTLPVTLPPPVVEQNGEAKVELARPEIAPRPKGANPFGNARPREEVLKEKGLDWKELDEKLEAAKIKDEEQRPAAAPFGKREFGSGGWRGGAQEEERVERTWRKPAGSETAETAGSETSRPASAESKEDGAVEAVEAAEDNKEAQI